MLMPKRVKHRKVQKGRMKGKATRGNKVTYGEYGLQTLEPGRITANQIEAARIAMTRVTRKPLETRMGKGKGAPEYWVSVVKPGRILFEIGGVSEELAREAMRLAGNKLPVKTKFVTKKEQEAETE